MDAAIGLNALILGVYSEMGSKVGGAGGFLDGMGDFDCHLATHNWGGMENGHIGQ